MLCIPYVNQFFHLEIDFCPEKRRLHIRKHECDSKIVGQQVQRDYFPVINTSSSSVCLQKSAGIM